MPEREVLYVKIELFEYLKTFGDISLYTYYFYHDKCIIICFVSDCG